MPVATADLAPGHTISRVIKGGWQLAGDHGGVERTQAIRDMEAFVDAGITTFDCADIYTGVEEMIGDFIADLRRRRGAETAARVKVHTKLVPDLSRLADLRPDEVEAIVDRSLARLRVETLDLVQFYWWDMGQGDPVAALEMLKTCRAKGKIRNLGVTNWDIAETEGFVAAGYDLVATQVQYSLLDRRAEQGLAGWAAARGIGLLSYGTLAGGFLTEAWLGQPDPGHAFANRSLVKYRLIIDEMGGWDAFQELMAVLAQIAARHGVAIPAVATAWVLDRPGVAAAIVGARYARHLPQAAAIVGARYARHLPQTLQVFDVALGAADRAAIDAVLARAPGPQGPVFGLERDRTGRHGRIMKYNLNTRPDDTILGAADG